VVGEHAVACPGSEERPRYDAVVTDAMDVDVVEPSMVAHADPHRPDYGFTIDLAAPIRPPTFYGVARPATVRLGAMRRAETGRSASTSSPGATLPCASTSCGDEPSVPEIDRSRGTAEHGTR
jgi:hypothetical protein